MTKLRAGNIIAFQILGPGSLGLLSVFIYACFLCLHIGFLSFPFTLQKHVSKVGSCESMLKCVCCNKLAFHTGCVSA